MSSMTAPPAATISTNPPPTLPGLQVLPVQQNLQGLWEQALANFKSTTSIGLCEHDLFKKLVPDLPVDGVIQVFEELQTEFKAFRGSKIETTRKWGDLRNKYLKPMVSVVLALNTIASGTVGSPVSPLVNRPLKLLTWTY